MPTSNDYSAAYNKLSLGSDLYSKKQEFETKFREFLNKYRNYSSVGTNSSPIFNIRNIEDLTR